MSEGGATTPSHPNMFRNIATGVITTVLGATAVYFLGFHNSGGGGHSSGNYLEIKEATTKAWKSYVTFENVYYKAQLSLMKDLERTKNLDDFKEGLANESRKLQRDLEELVKDKDIDKAFISMINRRLENEKNIEPKLNKYIDNIKAINESNISMEEKRQKLGAEDAEWLNNNKGVTERALTDIEDIAKTLSERYGQPFAMTDFLVYQYMKNIAKNDSLSTTTNNNNNTNNPGGNQIDNPSVNQKVSTNYGTTDNNNNSTNVNTNRNTITARTFVGEWDTPGAVITLSANGQMNWEMTTGQATSGTWQFYNNQLYMTYPNQYGVSGTYAFNLSNLATNSFTMTLSTYPYYRYDLSRYVDNY